MNVDRPVENDDLRFWAVLNRSNKIYEFLKRDEEKSVRQMELFAFWVRFDLASSTEEKIENERMIENTVGKTHIEHLRQLTTCNGDISQKSKSRLKSALCDESLIDAENGLKGNTSDE